MLQCPKWSLFRMEYKKNQKDIGENLHEFLIMKKYILQKKIFQLYNNEILLILDFSF